MKRVKLRMWKYQAKYRNVRKRMRRAVHKQERQENKKIVRSAMGY